MSRFIDLTQPLTDHMSVYPGDRPPILEKTHEITRDGFNSYSLSTTVHAGTHIDGPMHLTDSREFIGEIPVERFVGMGCILNVSGEAVLSSKPGMEDQIIRNGIVLLHTGFGKKFGSEEYYRDYPVLG